MHMQSQPTKSVKLIASLRVHKYLPAVWHSEDEDEDVDVEWDDESYEGEDAALAAEEEQEELRLAEERKKLGTIGIPMTMEPDDGMRWDNSAVEGMRARQMAPRSDTVRMTMTPSIVRDPEGTSTPVPLQKQEEDRKRLREEDSEDSLRKRAKGKEPQKMAPPVSSASYAKSISAGGSGSILRKERDTEGNDGKKKKSSVFGGIFGRKKDKDKKDKNGSVSSFDVSDSSRPSQTSDESSGRVSGTDTLTSSPTTQTAMQQQQQQQVAALRNSMDPRRLNNQPPTDTTREVNYPSGGITTIASEGPTATVTVAASVSALNSYSSSSSGLGPPTQRTRPGSLILNQDITDGHMPELSVIRVFAGKNLQTEATFKTVLLTSSTTSSELVKQALQRFRLPAAEDSNDYYLTVKQVKRSSAILHDTEKPLVVFESLVEAAMEVPKVKRSSMGSISSISSNLSMHPAIKELPMNDFSNDSVVKFYLNRKDVPDGDSDVEHNGAEEDTTLIATDTSTISELEVGASPRHLTVSTQGNVSVERFSSPSFRFAMQVIIYPEDLPDDVVFDPLTEAIVFKHTLRDKLQSSQSQSSGILINLRRKVFVFPKNVTVAEVIEIGLERFGILDGMVDGGDEVEDKLAKRRSSSRMRYGLSVDMGGQVSLRYSYDDSVAIDAHVQVRSRSATPVSAARPGTTRPTNISSNRRNPSIASVLPDGSGYITANSHGITSPIERERSTPTPTSALISAPPLTPLTPPSPSAPVPTPPYQQLKTPTPTTKRPPPIHIKEDFGVSHILSVIDFRAMKPKTLNKPGGRSDNDVDPVNDMLFGRPIDLDSLHPKIRELYADSFKGMAEMDEILDKYLLQRTAAGKN
ncbi:hypothetical protein HHX47_DHR2001091 [Lentinula edodes]|nr:hypothetical protein HHX47_DHR2001091 [Lentinula edodes]